MRVKVFGTGPIHEATLRVLAEAGCEVVAERPYDLVILANVLRILKADEIAESRLGVLCFHPSLLPRHRGPDAVYWTLQMGDAETGVTWFWIDEGIDTGPIAIQAAVPVPPEASAGRLYYGTLVPLGERLLRELLAQLQRGERPATPQDERFATYEPRRDRAAAGAASAASGANADKPG